MVTELLLNYFELLLKNYWIITEVLLNCYRIITELL